jgi:DUF1707 SHOCT-like domain
MPNDPDRLPSTQLRASDQDRERIAEVLHKAAAEGRLDLNEADERLNAAYAARTYAELEPLVRDLPGSVPIHASSTVSKASGDETRDRSGAVAIMSGFSRRGPWIPPRVFNCLAFWGGGLIDLRDARFAHQELTIRAFAIMGGVTVIVPEDAEVRVTGIGIMGGFDDGSIGAGRTGGPRVTITGFAFWGGVGVQRRGPKKKKRSSEITR